MSIIFYPHEEDLQSSPLPTRLELLMTAAERYKAIVSEIVAKPLQAASSDSRMTPKDMIHSYNWQELAKLLRELRDLPEQNPANRLAKAGYLTKLAEVYEVLRGARMPKLEAVRLALMNEVSQLKGSA